MLHAINFLKCIVTEIILVSIAAFKTLDISQGSVVTHLRCGGIFSDSIIRPHRSTTYVDTAYSY